MSMESNVPVEMMGLVVYEDFIGWLQSLITEGKSSCGSSNHSGACPVAQYMRATGHPDCTVFPCRVYDRDNNVLCVNPPWLCRFICLIDQVVFDQVPPTTALDLVEKARGGYSGF